VNEICLCGFAKRIRKSLVEFIPAEAGIHERKKTLTSQVGGNALSRNGHAQGPVPIEILL